MVPGSIGGSRTVELVQRGTDIFDAGFTGQRNGEDSLKWDHGYASGSEGELSRSLPRGFDWLQ